MEHVGPQTLVIKFFYLVAAAILIASGAANAAAAMQSLGILLQDPSTDPSIEHMRIVLDRQKVKPGQVMLHAENQSRTLVHEVVIAHDDGADELPLDGNHDLVIESRIRVLGAIKNLLPGKIGTLTLTLRPGSYLLFCNLPGHYLDGMVIRFMVVPDGEGGQRRK
jgi:uncharacterized cupredoxin-like copper-binding protein